MVTIVLPVGHFCLIYPDLKTGLSILTGPGQEAEEAVGNLHLLFKLQGRNLPMALSPYSEVGQEEPLWSHLLFKNQEVNGQR